MSGACIAGPVIESIQAACYSVPTEAPEEDGTARWEATTVVVVTAVADGESGIGWSYAPQAAALAASDLLAPRVVGQDAFAIPAIALSMDHASRNAGRTGVVAAAISAVDIALWDLKARLLSVPVVSLLGAAREATPAYGSGGFVNEAEDALRNEIEAWLESGFHAVKIKIGQDRGRSWRRDLRRVALARDVLGDRAELFVDANGAFSPGQARRMERLLRIHGVSWFEEPVTSDNPGGLAEVRAGSAMEIAAGEYVWRLPDACALVAAGAVDCLQLDVTRCGGFSGWMRGAALAAAHGLDVSAHCAPALSSHAACATPNARHLEYFRDHARLEPMLFSGVPTVTGGTLAPPPDAAGHGMALREDAQQYRKL